MPAFASIGRKNVSRYIILCYLEALTGSDFSEPDSSMLPLPIYRVSKALKLVIVGYIIADGDDVVKPRALALSPNMPPDFHHGSAQTCRKTLSALAPLPQVVLVQFQTRISWLPFKSRSPVL